MAIEKEGTQSRSCLLIFFLSLSFFLSFFLLSLILSLFDFLARSLFSLYCCNISHIHGIFKLCFCVYVCSYLWPICPKNPLALDIIVDIVSEGIQLRFEPQSQRLKVWTLA